MIHRHLVSSEWSLAAIHSLFERGGPDDWRALRRALAQEPDLAAKVERAAQTTEEAGAAALARLLIRWQASTPADRIG